MDDSLYFHAIKEIELNEKLNLIRLPDDGLTYSELYTQFDVSNSIVELIVKNNSQYEHNEPSNQKRNFSTLQTKIIVIHLLMKKSNANEAEIIREISRKIAKPVLINHEKWVDLEESGVK